MTSLAGGHETTRGRARPDVGEAGPPPATIRNIVLVGHAAAGKTTLLEALLVQTGALGRAGRVEEGTTVCDHAAIEKRRGRAVCLAGASTLPCSWSPRWTTSTA